MGVESDSLVRAHSVRLPRRTRRERSRERRRLALRDRQSARLAELVSIRQLLAVAVESVERGWLQDAWFSYRGPGGEVRISHVADRSRAGNDPVLASCLVAAIREASGIPEGSSTQVLGRALEVTWHTLHGDRAEPVRWCPAPDVRASHVRDLTRWNDRAGRTSGEVVTLLEAAIDVADLERKRIETG
jgi:hypothetical protein